MDLWRDMHSRRKRARAFSSMPGIMAGLFMTVDENVDFALVLWMGGTYDIDR